MTLMYPDEPMCAKQKKNHRLDKLRPLKYSFKLYLQLDKVKIKAKKTNATNLLHFQTATVSEN